MKFQAPGGPAGRRAGGPAGRRAPDSSGTVGSPYVLGSHSEMPGPNGPQYSKTGSNSPGPGMVKAGLGGLLRPLRARRQFLPLGPWCKMVGQAGVPKFCPREDKTTRWSHTGCSRVPASLLRH
jgi:hypothetical protein